MTGQTFWAIMGVIFMVVGGLLFFGGLRMGNR